MHDIAKLLHVAAAVFWLGGIGFLLFVLRPVAMAQLLPATRLPMMTAVLRRFFALVWLAVVTLVLTGGHGMAAVRSPHPAGWHAMAAIGILMALLFGHVYFSPFRKLKAAVAAADWPAGGRWIEQIVWFARVIFALGWLAIGAVLVLR